MMKIDNLAVKHYCQARGYDYNKLITMPKGRGRDFCEFYFYDPERGKAGLLNETPMQVVLRVDSREGKQTITETEYTPLYLQTVR